VRTTAEIVERLDRLARDLMVQELTLANLRRDGFELVSVAEPDLMASADVRDKVETFAFTNGTLPPAAVPRQSRYAAPRRARMTFDGAAPLPGASERLSGSAPPQSDRTLSPKLGGGFGGTTLPHPH